ncbi:MAG TPA: acetyl-coenzyme A synthetase, partial [Gammaproteobacteria bacterium]|nr:acetyl-coenzyme A synthetase [Gammaproteobacteria bacterium]
MSEIKTYPVSASVAEKALLNNENYLDWYSQSITDRENFWAERATEMIDWSKPWSKVVEENLAEGEVKWFIDAETNVSSNCLDRHLAKRADQTAIIWEGDDPSDSKQITYRELHEEVCRLANLLKSRGVSKGDRVCIYMPMIPAAAAAMLACTRIGAIHSVVFGGFSPDALASRILDSDCQTIITADEGIRGGRPIPLKANVDTALQQCPNVHSVITVKHTGGEIGWQEGRDVWYQEALQAMSSDCPAEPMDAEDPLFILYTSGSTGKPKGVMHTTGGYILYAAMTHKYVFDYHDG